MKSSRLVLGFMLMAMLCACHKSHNRQAPVKENHIAGNIDVFESNNKDVKKLLKEAESWLGVPYKYGGNDRDGVDCSGMVVQVFLRSWDLKLPRTCLTISEYCQVLEKKDIKAGDLVFFATGKDPEKISHVGILLDNDRFIHSSTSKGVVVSNLSSPYYQRTFRLFGRINR